MDHYTQRPAHIDLCPCQRLGTGNTIEQQEAYLRDAVALATVNDVSKHSIPKPSAMLAARPVCFAVLALLYTALLLLAPKQN